MTTLDSSTNNSSTLTDVSGTGTSTSIVDLILTHLLNKKRPAVAFAAGDFPFIPEPSPVVTILPERVTGIPSIVFVTERYDTVNGLPADNYQDPFFVAPVQAIYHFDATLRVSVKTNVTTAETFPPGSPVEYRPTAGFLTAIDPNGSAILSVVLDQEYQNAVPRPGETNQVFTFNLSGDMALPKGARVGLFLDVDGNFSVSLLDRLFNGHLVCRTTVIPPPIIPDQFPANGGGAIVAGKLLQAAKLACSNKN